MLREHLRRVRQTPSLREQPRDKNNKLVAPAFPSVKPEADRDTLATVGDYDIAISSRMTDLGAKQLGLSSADCGWHTPMLVTLREWSSRNLRQRSHEGAERRHRQKKASLAAARDHKEQKKAAKKAGQHDRPPYKRPASNEEDMERRARSSLRQQPVSRHMRQRPDTAPQGIYEDPVLDG